MKAEARRILLLNTTNHPIRTVYPYAFVQVSEVARRYGIEVRRVDLYGVPGPRREAILRRHLQQFEPSMVGVTLRNTDSQMSTDYMRQGPQRDYGQPVRLNVIEQMTQGLPPYYPTHDTRELITHLRRLTTAPIIVGGFGFSVQPKRSMEFLQPDFGVIGDPDPVLARFEDVLARRSLADVDNLCYVEDGAVRVNRRVFIGPSPNREYVDDVVADRNLFFGAGVELLPATFRAIPIEVMRGCPYLCTFCAEPHVKGNRAQFRDLDVVVDELAFLHGHGLNFVWFVCSEINAMGNNRFALDLAERLIRLNEKRSEAERVRWYTYFLLRFTPAELKTLRRAGFLGGWNDIPSFDDTNLKRLRVPYRTRHLVQSIRDIAFLAAEETAAAPRPRASLEERVFDDPEQRRGMSFDDLLAVPILSLFLGNQFATVETVRETLRVMERERLVGNFDGAFTMRAERVFDYNAGDGADPDATRAFPPPSASPTPGIDPTFRLPPELLRQLGSFDALEQFFIYVEDTFLSHNHLFRKEWSWFVGTTMSVPAFHALWLAAIATKPALDMFTKLDPVRQMIEHIATEPSLDKTRLLFFPAAGRKAVAQAAADAAIRIVLEAMPEARRRLAAFLAVPTDALGRVVQSPYGLACELYKRFADTDQLDSAARRALSIQPDSLEHLALADFLYRNSVDVRPEYRPFFAA